MSTKTLETAKIVVANCMGTTKEEQLLIVTDAGKFELAHIFAQAGRELGIATTLVEGNIQNGGEPAPMVVAAMEKADVCLLITSGSFTHTQARANANKRGCRIASMPTITQEIVDATCGADYDEIEAMSTAIAALFTKASTLHLTTPLGSDLTLDISGRGGIPDTGKLTWAGAFGNLPAGESMVAPVENKGNGTLVVDGVIAGVGLIEKPITLQIQNGKIISVEGDEGKLTSYLQQFEPTVYNIAEFGIGTNKLTTIMNNPLCDEKVFSTIHVGLGNNLFMGGAQDCNMHMDMIVKHPTVYLDDVCIIKDGVHLYAGAPAAQ